MSKGISRRHFFFGTLLAGVIPRGGFGSVPSLKALGYQSPNEKMNIAGIGAGGRAISVLGALESENIVALADVDWARGAEGFKRWEKATKYKDFRQLLDKEKGIDAVTVVIPDHMHATVALAAMQRGKHVYVEKPLTRTPWEARLLTEAAAKYKVATQMGNQGYSHEATRVAAEIIWSGEIGDVTEVHSFRGRASWPQGMPTLPALKPFPIRSIGISGSVARRCDRTRRATTPTARSTNQQFGFYLPFNWRGFFDFRQQLDWRLGNPSTRPRESCAAARQPDERRVRHAGRGAKPLHVPARRRRHQVGVCGAREHAAGHRLLVGYRRPLYAGWHDGGRDASDSWQGSADRGGAAAVAVEREAAVDLVKVRAARHPEIRRLRLLVAAEAVRAASNRAAATTRCSWARKAISARADAVRALACFRDRAGPSTHLPPRMLTRSPGHQRDWIRACKGGEPACSNFSIAGPYTEWMVLGAVAARVEGKLLWDPKKMEFTNNKEANKFVKPVFRKGWELKSVT